VCSSSQPISTGGPSVGTTVIGSPGRPGAAARDTGPGRPWPKHASISARVQSPRAISSYSFSSAPGRSTIAIDTHSPRPPSARSQLPTSSIRSWVKVVDSPARTSTGDSSAEARTSSSDSATTTAASGLW
jgi:hypothetical protein